MEDGDFTPIDSRFLGKLRQGFILGRSAGYDDAGCAAQEKDVAEDLGGSVAGGGAHFGAVGMNDGLELVEGLFHGGELLEFW